MEKLLIYLTFLPWLLYFIFYIIKVVKNTKLVKKELYFKWLKEHIFLIFRFDNLVLILIFLHFVKYNNDFVDKLLFSAINLYLFVNNMYDKNYNKNRINKSEVSLLILIAIATSVPFIYYTNTNNLQDTYKMMFAYTFFAYFIVIIAKIINMPLIRLLNKKKEKNM